MITPCACPFILMSFSKMYNYVEEITLEPKKEKTEFIKSDITPWQDYNERTDILDIIGNEFKIISNNKNLRVL